MHCVQVFTLKQGKFDFLTSIMSTKNKKDCPEVYLIEAYISHQTLSNSDREKVSHHLKLCSHCQALATELKRYYTILKQEQKKPVSNSLFRLIADIEKEKTVIAGILLQPDRVFNNPNTIEYLSELILTNQNNDSLDIDDLDCIPLEDNEIFIRAIQSRETLETTLFLFAHNEKWYRNVKLELKSEGLTFLSDEIGKVELGNFDINDLNNQKILITSEKK